MPSTPNLFDFSGLVSPGRPSQARTGPRRDGAWRSRGTRFYCVSTIAFSHAIADFEALSVVFFGQRYLLGPSMFLVFLRLLFAEGAAVTHADLADAIALSPGPARVPTVARHVQRLQATLAARGQGDLLCRERGSCALRLARPAAP